MAGHGGAMVLRTLAPSSYWKTSSHVQPPPPHLQVRKVTQRGETTCSGSHSSSSSKGPALLLHQPHLPRARCTSWEPTQPSPPQWSLQSLSSSALDREPLSQQRSSSSCHREEAGVIF